MTEKNHLIKYWPNGNKKREGFYKEGRSTSVNDKTGVWTSWYENGQIKAEVSHGRGGYSVLFSCRNGPATSWYENGQMESEIWFTNGHLDGYVTMWHDNGQKALKGEFIGGEKTGEWQTWHKSGQLQYQGFFYSLLSHSDYFQDGLTTWESVKEAKYNYDDEWMSDDDILDDEEEESWMGQTIDFWWDDWESSKEGTWTEWYENGQKKSETIYKDYDEYQSDVFQHYLPSEKKELATEWYKNGQKKSEGFYIENCKVGKFREWFASGEIKSITYYVNSDDYAYPYGEYWWGEDLKDGKCIVFYKNGLIKSEKYYIKGKLLETEKYPSEKDL